MTAPVCDGGMCFAVGCVVGFSFFYDATKTNPTEGKLNIHIPLDY